MMNCVSALHLKEKQTLLRHVRKCHPWAQNLPWDLLICRDTQRPSWPLSMSGHLHIHAEQRSSAQPAGFLSGHLLCLSPSSSLNCSLQWLFMSSSRNTTHAFLTSIQFCTYFFLPRSTLCFPTQEASMVPWDHLKVFFLVPAPRVFHAWRVACLCSDWTHSHLRPKTPK